MVEPTAVDASDARSPSSQPALLGDKFLAAECARRNQKYDGMEVPLTTTAAFPSFSCPGYVEANSSEMCVDFTEDKPRCSLRAVFHQEDNWWPDRNISPRGSLFSPGSRSRTGRVACEECQIEHVFLRDSV